MATLLFTGQQSTVEMDTLLGATLDGKPIGVRITMEVMGDYGLNAAQDKALEKVKIGKLEPNGGIRVTTADFA
jgi:hypothetical protein